MSKIERALRKAEEERRKKAPVERSFSEAPSEVLVPARGLAAPAEALPLAKHLSESFRKITARLKTCCENMGITDVAFTSSISEEGKTTTAVNCALSLSQDFNLSVCLVDCDLRRPKLSDYFVSNGSPGIIEVLKGQAEVSSVIQPTSIRGLSLVHSRRAGRLSLPLLNTQRLSKLVHELRARFDFVILDTAPILPIADSAVIAKNVSAIVLIIESGRTRKKHIEQIFEQIDREKVVGFIMNHKKFRVPEPYNYKKYYDYGLENDGAGVSVKD